MLFGGTDAAIGMEVPSSPQHSPQKKKPGTALYRAKAFKEKEEEKHFERGFTIHQPGIPGIDQNQEKWRLATIGLEMFAKCPKLRFAHDTRKEFVCLMKNMR